MVNILQVILLLIFPALTLILVKHSRFFAWLSSVIICYLFGIMLGNLPFYKVNLEISRAIIQITVPLAIPLLLFSTDFIRWLRLAKKTVISFSLTVVAVIVTSAISAHFFAHRIDESWKIAGMLVGVYTGGTPNMSAIGLALGVREETFIMLNGADVIVSSIYLIFLMTFAQRLLLLFMPAFKQDIAQPGPERELLVNASQIPKNKAKIKTLSFSFALAVIIVVLSTGFSLLILKEISVTMIILTITTLGIAGSFSPKIRNVEGTYELGQYILLIFCVTIGTLANIKNIMSTSPLIFYYCAAVVFGSILLHYTLAAILRIDADTAIITSTAAIFGPAFVGPIAGVLKNREIVISGLTSGLVGYALGNYFGLLTAFLLKP